MNTTDIIILVIMGFPPCLFLIGFFIRMIGWAMFYLITPESWKDEDYRESLLELDKEFPGMKIYHKNASCEYENTYCIRYSVYNGLKL